MNGDQQDCIVVRAKCCGRVVMATVNLPEVMDAAMKRGIAEYVIAGFPVEHHTAEEARKLEFGCRCARTERT
jgi:hypothetical protein